MLSKVVGWYLLNTNFDHILKYLLGYQLKNQTIKIQLRDIQDVLELIGGRWRAAILASLCDSPKRFSEIKEDLGYITPRILIKELRYLELNRMIIREKSTHAANSVLYSNSEHGKTIEPLIRHL